MSGEYKDCRKFGRKNFGELNSIYIGNGMEIVKIGKKHLAKCCNSPKFFHCQCFLLYAWVYGIIKLTEWV